MATATQQTQIERTAVSEQQARNLAAEAYIYGYPLVLMDITREVCTNVRNAGHHGAPINQFAHMPSFPDETMRTVVSPNADTLYSSAFLDLSKGPVVFSVPDMAKRYYLMQMLDAWTNTFACPGTRTTGSSEAAFVIVGPTRSGSLPEGVQVIKSPTSLVWILGRTQTNGKGDYPSVRAIQQQYELRPLSEWRKLYVPPDDLPVRGSIDMGTPPVEQLNRMNTRTFLSRLNSLMQENPPATDDAEAIHRFSTIGVGPGRIFEPDTLATAIAAAIEKGTADGLAKIIEESAKPHGTNINGWQFTTNVGRYGTNYLRRAVIAMIGIGANLPEDAVYLRATKDALGEPFSGTNTYEVHFLKDQLPPVGAFWSITMYNSKQFFVNNAIDRYAIGDRDKLKFDSDGSLTLYIRSGWPGREKEFNWLPAPKDSFNLVLRLYWPKKEVLEGMWQPPAVKRVETKRA